MGLETRVNVLEFNRGGTTMSGKTGKEQGYTPDAIEHLTQSPGATHHMVWPGSLVPAEELDASRRPYAVVTSHPAIAGATAPTPDMLAADGSEDPEAWRNRRHFPG